MVSRISFGPQLYFLSAAVNSVSDEKGASLSKLSFAWSGQAAAFQFLNNGVKLQGFIWFVMFTSFFPDLFWIR